MSNPKVYFTSDLHIGHRNILKFTSEWRQGSTVEEHDEWIVDSWNSVVHKKDNVWILGDLLFGGPGTKDVPGQGWDQLKIVKKLNGQKNLILGNHDQMPISAYVDHFNQIKGFMNYKNFWASHAPVHPAELRGRKNIHGHVHHNTIELDDEPDPRYINVCVEANIVRNGTILTEFDWIKENFASVLTENVRASL